MGNKYKVIVAHPGRQHSYQLAKALKKEGILFKYITTVYDKNSSFIMKLTKKFIDSENLKRASNRRCPELDDVDVIQFYEFRGLLELLLIRIDKKRKILSWWGNQKTIKFGKKVARYAIKNDVDAVILYDASANDCFRILSEKAPQIKRIMDVSAANRIFMKKIYENDMERNEKFAKKLYKERDFLWESDLGKFYDEIKLSQYFLVPSSFVKNSLIFSNVLPENIYICPYGTNFNLSKGKHFHENQRLRLVFVGNVTEMKGISYLFDAVKGYDSSIVSLSIVGAYDNSSGIFDEYISRYNFLGRLQHKDVEKVLHESDVFVFPSLGEGMSLAALEAMSCGLPIICTTNSGVNDLIVDGENGFVIPIGDSQSITEKIDWFINNRNMLPQMSKEAQRTANKYTWENYEKKVINIVDNILKNN